MTPEPQTPEPPLRLKERYHCEDIYAALVHASKYFAFDAKAVERILKARYAPRELEFVSNRSAAQCAALLPEIKQRPLSAYSGLVREAAYDGTGEHPQTLGHAEALSNGKGAG